ncbi:hypothetical protein pdam_00002604 [Pocillopora damicornis]|uniref:Amine oxidase domain-containing protein n=1 Tax=Pocillopora damicornis TaxID=46731 RepID=A0A3M6U3B7_POCDA|nr:hypothetical protein pdam_00002604 [Pocillopora damicornis]
MSADNKMPSPHRLLIVGAGLTGSVTASLLRRKFPKEALNITFWEKSRGAGGRMNTNRSASDSRCTVDLGAQYVTATPDYYRSHESFYQELISAKVLVPFNGIIEGENKKEGMKNFTAPSGMNSIVKNFLNSSDPEDIGPSLLAHTSVPFGIEHLEMDMNDVKEIIISHVKQILPDLPEPVNSRCLRWRYSQVSRGVDGSPGCIALCNSPLLVACGDAFSHSNFDGCIDSAMSVVDTFCKITSVSNL